MRIAGILTRLLPISVLFANLVTPLNGLALNTGSKIGVERFQTISPAITHTKTFNFSLPSQSLAKSLAEFSRVISRVIIFDPSVVENLTGRTVYGNYTPKQAISILIEGLPVAVEYSGYGWLVKTVPQKKMALDEYLPNDEPHLSEVLVIGRYSSSLRSAIRDQKNSLQNLEVVNSEDVGRFPSLNIGEALNRSPGVSVVRDRGEALFLSIRGLPTEFNMLTLNGLPLATNENVRTSEQYGRRFHYDILPAAMVGKAEIKKTMAADDIEGSVGGGVNIILPTPFSIGEPQFNMELSQHYSDLRKGSSPGVVMSGNWLNETENIGVYSAFEFTNRQLRQDRVLNFGWKQAEKSNILLNNLAVSNLAVKNTDGSIVYTPGGVRPTLELEDRERVGVNFSIETKISDESALELNYLDLRHLIEYNEYSVSADYEFSSVDEASTVWRNNLLIGGTASEGSVQIGRESAGISDRLQSFIAHYNTAIDEWRYRCNAGLSKTTSQNNDPIRRTRFRRENDVAFDFYFPKYYDSALPEIHYKNIDLLSERDFPGRRLEWRVNNAIDSVGVIDVSIEKSVSFGVINNLKIGASLRDRERQYSRKDAVITEAFSQRIFSAEYFSAFPVENFSTKMLKSEVGLPSQWLVPNEDRIWAEVSDSNIMSSLLLEQNMRNQYAVSETIGAAFVKANIEWNNWQGNVGGRVVSTRQESSGFVVDDVVKPVPVLFSTQYTKLLPSINIRNDFRTDMIFRFSLSNTLSRPDLQDLAPRLTLNSGDESEGKGGNPYLMPMTAWEFDSGFEYYFMEDGLTSVSLFYKKISGFIQSGRSSLVVNGTPYIVFSKRNGDNANVFGVEFEYRSVFSLPKTFGGRLGVGANATLSTTNATYLNENNVIQDRLSDVAEKIANLELFYETNFTSLRLNYSWRSDVVAQVGAYDYFEINNESFGSIDLHASFRLNSWAEIFIEGVNVTNNAEKSFVKDNEFAGYTLYGRTAILGVRIAL